MRRVYVVAKYSLLQVAMRTRFHIRNTITTHDAWNEREKIYIYTQTHRERETHHTIKRERERAREQQQHCSM